MATNQKSLSSDIPLKYALAAIAVHKRQSDQTQHQLLQKVHDLETKLHAAKQQLKENKLKFNTSIASIFTNAVSAATTTDRNHSSPIDLQLHNSVMWAQTTDLLPTPGLQTCISQIQHYLLLKQLRQQTTTSAYSFLNKSPVEAVVETLIDLIAACGENATATEEIQDCSLLSTSIQNAAVCLATIVSHPSLCMAESDGACLDSLITTSLQTACSSPATATPEENNNTETAAILPASSLLSTQQVSQQILSTLTASPGCGLLILSNAAKLYQASLCQLVADVTGENLFPTTNTATATAATTSNASSLTESELLFRLNELAPFLHRCLRALPAWVTAAAPTEDFLKDIVDGLWKSNDIVKVVSVTHVAVCKQAQRTTALLVSALHQLKEVTTETEYESHSL